MLILVSCVDDNTNVEYEWKDYSVDVPVDFQSISMVNSLEGFVGGTLELNEIEQYSSILNWSSYPEIVENLNLIINPDTNLLSYNTKLTYPEVAMSKLFKTIDGGVTWQPIKTPFISGVLQLQFLSNEVGYVITKTEGVYKTIDGGVSWRKILEPVIVVYKGWLVSNPYSGLCFLDENNGYIYGKYCDADIVLRTVDGGISWKCLNLTYRPPHIGPESNNFGRLVMNIQFPGNGKTGFVCTTSNIFITNDGGETWSKVNTPDDGTIIGSFFYDEKTFFLTSNNKMTVDGGVTWEYFNKNGLFNTMSNSFFPVSAKEYYCSDYNKIYHGDINNKTVTEMSCETKMVINAITFVSPNLGIAVGRDGKILRYSR